MLFSNDERIFIGSLTVRIFKFKFSQGKSTSVFRNKYLSLELEVGLY